MIPTATSTILLTDTPPKAASGARRPEAVTASFVALAAYLLAWTLLPLLLDEPPPGDNYEQLSWVTHPAWGYSKHPPFPTWILWGFQQFLPHGIPLTYALGGLQVAAMLWLARRLGRATLGEGKTWVALLLTTCITYYTNRMHFYNHNTALLVAYAASAYSAWNCVRGPRGWWVALGASWGLGMLSKYQMAIGIVCNVAFIAASASIPRRIKWRGILVSGAVATLLLAPHVVWLVVNNFPTFTYASKSLGAELAFDARVVRVLHFLTDQVVRALPMLLLLVLFASLRRGRWGVSGNAVEAHGYDCDSPGTSAEAARFWRIHAWGPPALMVGLSVVAGVDLQTHWGTAFLWALPFWWLSTRPNAWFTSLSPRAALSATAAVQVVMMFAYAVQDHSG